MVFLVGMDLYAAVPPSVHLLIARSRLLISVQVPLLELLDKSLYIFWFLILIVQNVQSLNILESFELVLNLSELGSDLDRSLHIVSFLL